MLCIRVQSLNQMHMCTQMGVNNNAGWVTFFNLEECYSTRSLPDSFLQHICEMYKCTVYIYCSGQKTTVGLLFFFADLYEQMHPTKMPNNGLPHAKMICSQKRPSRWDKSYINLSEWVNLLLGRFENKIPAYSCTLQLGAISRWNNTFVCVDLECLNILRLKS